MPDSILLGESRNNIFIQACGRATASLCLGLRDKVLHQLEQADQIEGIYVELSTCEYMDSTFIGLLVGFSKHRKVTLLQPSRACLDAFSALKLEDLLNVQSEQAALPETMTPVAVEQATADLLIESHEHLMAASEENRKKFSLLKQLLERRRRADPNG